MAKSRTNPVTDEQVIANYQETHSAYETARALGIGATTVHRILQAHKVPRDGLQKYRKDATKFVGQEADIRAYYESGATMKQVIEKFGGVGGYSVKRAILRAGGTLRENPAPLVRDDEVAKIRALNAEGHGQTHISLALGRSQTFVSRLMRRNGIKPLKSTGLSHGNWKGGRYKDGNGYIRAWIACDDPLAIMALNDSHVLEHRLVMARSLGRPLRRSETVHHINGDRTDNRLENLQLRQGKHGKNAAYRCCDCGSTNVQPVPLAKESSQ